MKIRPHQPSDQPHLIDMLRANTPASFAKEEEPDFIFYLKHETELYFVLEEENQIIACGGINFDQDGHTARISWDMVHPEFQGKGAGTQLLQYRINLVRQMKQIDTLIVRTSQTAYGFYEKNGFFLEEINKDYWAKGFDLYLMRQSLS